MSLRYTSRVFYQAGMRVMQGMKDQASKFTESSNLRCLKDSATATASSSSSSSSSSSKQARVFSNTVDSAGRGFKAKNERLKQAEESLRTIMYLSCWGPN